MKHTECVCMQHGVDTRFQICVFVYLQYIHIYVCIIYYRFRCKRIVFKFLVSYYFIFVIHIVAFCCSFWSCTHPCLTKRNGNFLKHHFIDMNLKEEQEGKKHKHSHTHIYTYSIFNMPRKTYDRKKKLSKRIFDLNENKYKYTHFVLLSFAQFLLHNIFLSIFSISLVCGTHPCI